jgi:hypothetical protein
MRQEVPDDFYSFENIWEQEDDIPEGMRNEITALLLSAAFRGLQSRDDQLLFLGCQPFKFPYAVIATLFKLSPFGVYRAIRKGEKANDNLQLPQSDSLEKPAPIMTLSQTEEYPLVAWIESRQRKCDCPSAREV